MSDTDGVVNTGGLENFGVPERREFWLALAAVVTAEVMSAEGARADCDEEGDVMFEGAPLSLWLCSRQNDSYVREGWPSENRIGSRCDEDADAILLYCEPSRLSCELAIAVRGDV